MLWNSPSSPTNNTATHPTGLAMFLGGTGAPSTVHTHKGLNN